MGTGLSAVAQVRKTVYCKVEREEGHTLTLRGHKKTETSLQPGLQMQRLRG